MTLDNVNPTNDNYKKMSQNLTHGKQPHRQALGRLFLAVYGNTSCALSGS